MRSNIEQIKIMTATNFRTYGEEKEGLFMKFMVLRTGSAKNLTFMDSHFVHYKKALHLTLLMRNLIQVI